MSRPTIADLAKTAGVSISTVDRVLNGRDPVRRKTAERVMAAAEEIGFYATNVIRHRLHHSMTEYRLGFLLQQGSRPFYRDLAEALRQAAKSNTDVRIRPVIVFMEDMTPGAVAQHIDELNGKIDVLGLVAAEHPLVTQAIDKLTTKGILSFALISSLSTDLGIGYIGLDNWKVGRTSAWVFANLCRTAGKIGILVGSHRYRCQEMNEMGFRSYFREYAPDFQVLEPMISAENKQLAAELTRDLLEREPDLAGIYISGGGITGVIMALRETQRADQLVVVGYELMEETRTALLDHTLNLVISHPLNKLAEVTINTMINAVQLRKMQDVINLPSITLPFDIYTPENI